MLCSVVVPVFNKAKYVGPALQSVIRQTYNNLEILVVDDGSTDESCLIVKNLHDPRIKLFSKTNSGVSSARNFGIDRSSGELIFFFDADDWMHPHYISSQVKCALDHPNIDFFAARFIRVPHNVTRFEDWIVPSEPNLVKIDDLPRFWLLGSSFITSSVSIRKRLLERLSPCFPIGESRGEDMDLWFRAAEATTILLNDSAMVAYRENTPAGLLNSTESVYVLPYVRRIRERASSGGVPKHRASSMLYYVNELEISECRKLMVNGQRLGAIWLLAKHRSFRSKRWWFSWIMLVSFSAEKITNWESSRIKKTRRHVDQR